MPIVLLDSTPLGLLANPRNNRQPVECRAWAKRLIKNDIPVLMPAIADYEVRRELIRLKSQDSINSLNELVKTIPLVDLSEEVLRKAAELWALARQTNQQTAHGERIDGDAIISAQAIILGAQYGEYVVVATGNVNHIRRYTYADEWRNITVENCFNPNLATSPNLASVSQNA